MEQNNKEVSPKVSLRSFLENKDSWIKSQKNTGRVLTFSDAVFAFAITLLILQINVPADWKTIDITDNMIDLWPEIFAYLIAFYAIAKFWLSHLNLFNYIKTLDRNFVVLNLLFLLGITFLPFPADLYGTHPDDMYALGAFAASLAFVGFISCALWWYVYRHPEMHYPNIDKRIFSFGGRQTLIVAISFLISLGILYLFPEINWGFWIIFLILNVGLSFISREYEKRYLKKKAKTA